MLVDFLVLGIFYAQFRFKVSNRGLSCVWSGIWARFGILEVEVLYHLESEQCFGICMV